MKEINIRLLHNEPKDDWSVEIDGTVHHSVPEYVVKELVKEAMNRAQIVLNEPARIENKS